MKSALHLGFKEDAGVGVPDAGEQQPLGFRRAAGNDHLQPRHVRVEGLRRLTVVVTTMSHSPCSRDCVPSWDLNL